jgi:hypothetical protein
MSTLIAFLSIAAVLVYMNLNFLHRNKDFD